MTAEPKRERPDAQLSKRMSQLRRHGTAPELALRRELHACGLRFRVQHKVPGNNRRTIDVAFTRAKLAVFVDGCFWHACPEHGTQPAANAEWWRWKLASVVARDRDTDRLLSNAGWWPLRLWEHENATEGAKRVEQVYRSLVGPTVREDLAW